MKPEETEMAPEDRTAAEAAVVSSVLDYFEGWFDGDATRVEHALHPGLAKRSLEPGGTLMIVEPNAADQLADNLNPVGAAYYAFSTMLCTSNSLAQDVGTALGAQAGEAQLREVITGAGFGSVRRAAETAFNIVLEARP